MPSASFNLFSMKFIINLLQSRGAIEIFDINCQDIKCQERGTVCNTFSSVSDRQGSRTDRSL